MTLKIGALTKLGLFFPVVCFIYVFDQTLVEQLYRDKGLLLDRLVSSMAQTPLFNFFIIILFLGTWVLANSMGNTERTTQPRPQGSPLTRGGPWGRGWALTSKKRTKEHLPPRTRDVDWFTKTTEDSDGNVGNVGKQ